MPNKELQKKVLLVTILAGVLVVLHFLRPLIKHALLGPSQTTQPEKNLLTGLLTGAGFSRETGNPTAVNLQGSRAVYTITTDQLTTVMTSGKEDSKPLITIKPNRLTITTKISTTQDGTLVFAPSIDNKGLDLIEYSSPGKEVSPEADAKVSELFEKTMNDLIKSFVNGNTIETLAIKDGNLEIVYYKI